VRPSRPATSGGHGDCPPPSRPPPTRPPAQTAMPSPLSSASTTSRAGRYHVSSASGVLAQYLVEPPHEEVRIDLRKDQRRSHLEDVAERTVGAGEHTELAQAVDDVGGLFGRGLERRAVADQLDAEEEARAPNVADQGMTMLQVSKRPHQ